MPASPPHDRPRQPRRHRRQPGLHIGGGAPKGSRSTLAICTGRTAAPQIVRADLDGIGARAELHPRRHESQGWPRGRRRPRLLDECHNTIGRANLDGTGVDQSFIGSLDDLEDSLYDAEGVAVDDLPRPPETTPPDTNPPQTKITKGAANKTDKTKVKFRFSSSEPDSTFECKLDKKTFKPCTSPKTIKHLDQGKHKFKVRAIDAAGNVDPTAAKDKFKVVG